MCRMIAARGNFDPDAVFLACQMMSCGQSAEHESPGQQHPDGWGAMWADGREGVQIHRSLAHVQVDASPRFRGRPVFLALHARQATLKENAGFRFAHPLAGGEAAQECYLMHNGYLPTVHKRLGLTESEFDSEEYFSFLLANEHLLEDRAALTREMDALEEGSRGGNMFLLKGAEQLTTYVWHPQGSPFTDFLTMWRWVGADAEIISSERHVHLAPLDEWRPVTRGEMVIWRF